MPKMSTPKPSQAKRNVFSGCCRRRGVGPAPVAVQKLNKARLVAQLRVLMQPEVIEAAAQLGSQMQQERDGAEAFVDVLHEHLTRWQKHCGVRFPVHGTSATAGGDERPGTVVTAAHGASAPVRPSDSSSSLAAPEAVAAAYDLQLKALKVRPVRAPARVDDAPGSYSFSIVHPGCGGKSFQ